MRVVPPLTVTPAMLTSSTIAEPAAGESVWVSGHSYSAKDVCILTATHRQYLCLAAVSGTTSPDLDPTHWEDNGPTNKWAMFDLLRNTASSLTGADIVTVLAPGVRMNSLGIVGLQAGTVTVSQDIGATNYYLKTISGTERHTTDYLSYCFGGFRYKPSIVLFDIPMITGATITVTISNGSGTALCGGLVLGSYTYIGEFLLGAVRDALNFTLINRDAFGNVVAIPRRSVPWIEGKLVINSSLAKIIMQLQNDLNGVPALWSGMDDLVDHDYFEAMLILGLYRQMTLGLDHETADTVSLKVEEM